MSTAADVLFDAAEFEVDPLADVIDFPIDPDASAGDWMGQAACAGHPEPDIWFPTPPGPGVDPMRVAAQTQAAKDICNGCPVREQCLEYAIAAGLNDGIFGGLTYRERRQVARGRHGTLSKWQSGCRCVRCEGAWRRRQDRQEQSADLTYDARRNGGGR